MDSNYLVLEDGLRMHYVTAGAVDATPLVLVHGYPTDWRLWRGCISSLAERYRVIAPDLPGHGLSDRRPELAHDLAFYVRCLEQFLDLLGLQQVYLAVHDLGGMAGLALAGRHPRRVRRLVVLDTAPSPNWWWPMRLALKLMRTRLVARLFCTRPGFWLMLRLFTTRQRTVLRRLVQVYRPMWADTPLRREMFRVAASLPPERMSPTLEDLAAIQQPTLVLWAEQDPIFPVSVARRLCQRLPRATLQTVPGSGHFVPEEAPEQVSGAILAFLERDSAASSPAAWQQGSAAAPAAGQQQAQG